MFQIILEILIDFGLLREDYKHHKKITALELSDGQKRPLKKYFLQPSALVSILAFLLITSSLIGFFIYQRTSSFPEETKTELSEMVAWANKWHSKYGEYPSDLKQLIGNNPMHQNWKTDAWKQPYSYLVSEDGKSFTLLSAGPDTTYETSDDLIAN